MSNDNRDSTNQVREREREILHLSSPEADSGDRLHGLPRWPSGATVAATADARAVPPIYPSSTKLLLRFRSRLAAAGSPASEAYEKSKPAATGAETAPPHSGFLREPELGSVPDAVVSFSGVEVESAGQGRGLGGRAVRAGGALA